MPDVRDAATCCHTYIDPVHGACVPGSFGGGVVCRSTAWVRYNGATAAAHACPARVCAWGYNSNMGLQQLPTPKLRYQLRGGFADTAPQQL